MLIALTGHRPEKCGGFDPANPIRTALRRKLREYIAANAVTAVISGMALGFDQDGARVALEAGVKLIAAVPCDEQDKYWPRHARIARDDLLARAHETVVVSPGEYVIWKMQARNEYMCRRALKEHGRLVAAWDKQHSGGTYRCVKFAELIGLRVDNIGEGIITDVR